MKRVGNKHILLLIICVTLLVVASVTYCSAYTASAEEIQETSCQSEEYEAKQPRLFTMLTLTLTASNGVVYANVRNDFTLFNSTVVVYVYLYSSSTYTEVYQDMTLESSSYTADLNIYETINTSKPTGGVEKYWRARTSYKIDGNAWESREYATVRISAAGAVL